MNKDLHRLDIRLKQEDAEIAQALLFEYIQYGWEEESIDEDTLLIRLHCEDKDILQSVKEMITKNYSYATFKESVLENKDWTEAWKQYFTPVSAGDFLVLPSWERDGERNGERDGEKNEEKSDDTIPIYIEPKSAFGTGHHATTALCLHALTKLKRENKLHKDQHFLDLGCGTGILGIACQKLGMTGLCVDIDPIAIANTEENLLLNNVQNQIQLKVGSIDVVSEKYEIVIANILAGPLKMLADEIIGAIKEKGFLILSGILSSQADDVCAAYAQLGKAIKLEAQDIPHLCPENIATDEIKPAETWVALIWEI